MSAIEFGPLSSAALRVDAGRTVVVTDPLVRKLHGQDFPPCPVIEVGRGEAAKSLEGLEGLWKEFSRLGVDRGSTVLAVGGGSLTDLAGFAASTWMRGVDLVLVPTTLLAMVDASLGGKNGIDLLGAKNLVGTFYEPRLVLVDHRLTDTLRDADFACGIAEAAKHAVIDGEEHLSFLERRCAGRASMSEADTEALVRLSVGTKSGIADRDPREGGERRKLNLGHTYGHALEAVTGISHGEAVSAGLLAAFALSARLAPDGASRQERLSARGRLGAFLSAWGLPVGIEEAAARSPSGPPDPRAVKEAMARALRSDKKRDGDAILFALPRAVGDVGIERVSIDTLCELLEELP